MKYPGLRLPSGHRAYFLEGHGKDISFDRWRVSAYYAPNLAETLFFPSDDDYQRFLRDAEGRVYTDFGDYRIDSFEAAGDFIMARWCREAREEKT